MTDRSSSTAQVPTDVRATAPAAPSAVGADTSARLDELEIKLAFAEDLLESLNALVARQAEQIEALGREVVRLKERTERGDGGVGGAAGAPADERPPHY